MYLYILYNKILDKYYIGITNNINRRVKEHCKNSSHGYTSRLNEGWRLVYNKKFNNRKEAYQEETRLKKAKNRKYLIWYIENNRAASSIGRATPS